MAPDRIGYLEPIPTGLTEDRYIKAVEFREIAEPTGKGEAPKGASQRAALNTFVMHHIGIAARTDLDDSFGATDIDLDPDSGQKVPGAFRFTHEHWCGL